MKIFELFLILSIFGFLISFFLKFDAIKKWTLYSSILFLMIHLLIEGNRWQLYPVYGLCALIPILYYFPNIKKWAKVIVVSFAMLNCGVSFALGILMPVMKFPEPSGSFSIGVQSLYLEDKSRKELLTKDDTDYRKLSVHIWYPSHQKIAKPENYMDQGYAEVFIRSKNMPSFIAGHFDLTKMHIERELSITNTNKLPIIILSHGLLWNSEMYTTIIEEIVSKGYIVIGIDHTYETFLTEYKGKRISWSRENIHKMNTNLDFKQYKEYEKLFTLEKDTIKKHDFMRKAIHSLPYFESLDRWSNDISFVINQLENFNVNTNHFLYQKLDMDSVGLLGHSWGGAAVTQNAAVNNKVKAVINMDGAQWGRLIDQKLEVPLMTLLADRDYQSFFTPNFYVYDKVVKDDFYEIIIKGTGHANFGDMSYWTKLHSLTDTGNINPIRMTHVTNKLILSFFDKYVRNNDTNLLKNFSASEYPEVVISLKKKNEK
ncbi:alpha/beta fold hydrolase [Aquimarina sp. AU474]|uniref:alpha/beta hydrolase family protein n=1 Tax=Aquimarina sp. AU474 TaxID=2108529 RepID=UPI000D699F83|nr:alpha/beta fold hydrolase [Aquimarina sp. AU474]